ncbi:conserved hypothetical protein [delta proteobacterium NaphS2]|nr:conserved hypothetical protein [delta proteobacterium NaphS2]
MALDTCQQREGGIEPEIAGKFSFALYFRVLMGILSSPRRFFSGLPDSGAMAPAMGCLLVSSLFYACAAFTQPHEQPLLTAAILFLNAVGMCFISAFLGFAAMIMTLGKRVAFPRFFSVYAFSSSVTLLAAWIPLFLWITEPWKWVLIAVGLVKCCALRWFQAIIVMGISIFVMVLFFWSIGPVIGYFKG